ncbi:GDP-mannose 4,6-dehydratase [Halegenticoccus tardaugens]|uniref:GDP-mannose 4,6-dehydratase n=1 Tax=Halegenticoccus tardaugens TaxID=2071624 RepID=UPI00100BE1D1|nr:GDP-mannose 4,6-dehydratase [Halegenticoccus tardaugens]
MPSALITGVTGQDGSYLAEYLDRKGYDVHGLVRRTSSKNYWRIKHLVEDDSIELIEGDLEDQVSLNHAVENAEPDEVYNLAAQSFVGTSFKQPLYTSNVTGLGVTRLLEAVRQHAPDARFYQASTSEMFGEVDEVPQTEETDFHPRSPYGVAKLYGYWSTINYREAYDMYAVNGILFNHESPRRGEEFVTRKITLGAARIKEGLQDELRLGNLDAKRDWGDARDYVKAMHHMLQQDLENLRDYVIGTGQTYTVRRCAEVAFDELGLDYEDYVVVDERFYRPAEVNVLQSNPLRAENELDWSAEVSFEEMIRDMARTDHQRVERGDERWVNPTAGLRLQPVVE